VLDSIPDARAGRAMLARSLDMYPINVGLRMYRRFRAGSNTRRTRRCAAMPPAATVWADLHTVTSLPRPVSPAHRRNRSQAATALRDPQPGGVSAGTAIAEGRGVDPRRHKVRIRSQSTLVWITLADEVPHERQFAILGF
jgi:hypothetical protein